MTRQSSIPQPDPTSAHRPADDAEEVYFDGPPLLRGRMGLLIGWWLVGLVLILGPLLIRTLTAAALPWWALLGCVVIGIGLFFVPLLALRTVRYRITNYRIDVERGLLGKQIDTLELWHVEDLRFTQSLSDRMLGVGTITVISHDDTTPQLILRGLPQPRPLFQHLEQRVISVKRQRGVIKTDSGT